MGDWRPITVYEAFFKLAQDGHGAAQLKLAILTAKGDGII